MSEMVIFALQVGGGTLAIAPLPGRWGTYQEDLEQFDAWKPGLVISMTTEAEMVEAGARHLGSDIQSMASRWAHLPVADFSVPPKDVTDAWPDVSASARQALRGGGRVLVHCRGGCGRSGMVALRLMVECGEHPDAALKRLRAVRACAVETDGQLAWALQGAQMAVSD